MGNRWTEPFGEWAGKLLSESCSHTHTSTHTFSIQLSLSCLICSGFVAREEMNSCNTNLIYLSRFPNATAAVRFLLVEGHGWGIMSAEKDGYIWQAAEKTFSQRWRSRPVNLQNEVREQGEIKWKQEADSSGYICIYCTAVLECILKLYSTLC